MNKFFLGGVLSLLILQPAWASDYDYSYTDQHAIEEDGSLYIGAGASLSLGDSFDTCDKHDLNCLGYRAYIGYKPVEKIAIEGSYMNFFRGRSSTKSNAKYENSGLGLAVLGMHPIKDNVEGFAKVGFVAWDATVDGQTQADGSDLMLGAGAQIKYRDNIHFRGELEYIGGDMDSVIMSSGVSYSTL